MFNSDSYFIYFFFAILFAFAVVRIIYYFKTNREPILSDLDKAIWSFRFNNYLAVSMLILFVFYMMRGGNYAPVYPDDSQEKVIRMLIENQNEAIKEITDLRDFLYLFLFLVVMYIFGVAEFVGKVQRHRQQESDKNNPEVQKPLGLS